MKVHVELMSEFKRRIEQRERRIKITWFVAGLVSAWAATFVVRGIS